ncbi:MAG: 2-oxoacid:acceptor oxidoreductase subunit alpha, partial [Propionibacteriaceae bacterium]|nr:2-oxoacid:acceptor oxidoreductase subunit alpha [Propionibacteriaceae bacterium]
TKRNLSKIGWDTNPLEDGSLDSYKIHAMNLTHLATETVKDFGLTRKDASRTKNMFALGLLSWLYSRPMENTVSFLQRKFATKPDIRDANIAAFNAGHAYGETTETFEFRYEVAPAPQKPGRYRQISGNVATAYGLMAGAHKADMDLFLGSYPITPASDILHELSKRKDIGVITFQAEDEIAGVAAALGASYGGALGVTSTSGPGILLKSETISLGVMTEIPLVVVNVQRAGPSTGMPTKTEQADLLQAIHGRNGEAPVPVIAAKSAVDCFATAIEACRIAIKYRTPVIMLSDGYLANGSEPWRIPDLDDIEPIVPGYATETNGTDAKGNPVFHPYDRDPETLARAYAIPGTPGLEHRIGGIEKAASTGNVSYDPDNHDAMVRTRQAKIDGIVRDIPDVEVVDPSGAAKVLVLGWGSTWGPITAASRRVRLSGRDVATAHLRHLNPMPANLGEVLRRFERVIIPEMNLGQLASLIRSRYLVDVHSYSRVRGLPISLGELERDLIDEIDRFDKEA